MLLFIFLFTRRTFLRFHIKTDNIFYIMFQIKCSNGGSIKIYKIRIQYYVRSLLELLLYVEKKSYFYR